MALAPQSRFRGNPNSPNLISPSELRSNPMRATLGEMIANQPGLCFSDLLRSLKATSEFGSAVGNGVLDWHLHRLERAGLIASHMSGRFRRYYPASGVHRPDAAAFAFLQSYGRWPIAQAIAASEGLTAQEVQARLAMPDAQLPALWRQLRLLCASGLAKSERLGRVCRYRATSRLMSAVTVLSRPAEASSAFPSSIHPGPSQSYPATVLQPVGGIA